ncbi:MAG: HEAT repeat domain-containing protein [Spirulinaceae cyanobacterium]
MSQDFQTKLQIIIEDVVPECRLQVRSDIDLILATGAKSYHDWITLLKEQKADAEMLKTICWTLARLGDDTALPALLTTLKTAKPLVRAEAALALGTLGNKECLSYLLDTLNEDEDIKVRSAAAYAVGLLGNKEAVKQLVKVLENQHENSQVRGQAAEALSDLGDTQAVVPLIKALKDDSVEVRFWSAFALGQLGSPQAIPELEKLATTDSTTLPGWGTINQEAQEAIEAIRSCEISG